MAILIAIFFCIDERKPPAIPKNRRGRDSFEAFFQSGCGQVRQVDPFHTVLGGEDEALGQIITGHHPAFQFRCVQEFPAALGSGGVVQIKNTDDRAFPHRHIIANVQVHVSSPL